MLAWKRPSSLARESFDEMRIEVEGAALVLTALRVHAAGVATRVRVDRQAGDGFMGVLEGDALDDALAGSEVSPRPTERAAASPAAALGSGGFLSEAYPNPTPASASLSLSVEEAQRVRVVAYDLTGRRVAVLHDGVLAEGTVHTLRFDGEHLPAGVYLVRAEGESFLLTRRLLLVE